MGLSGEDGERTRFSFRVMSVRRCAGLWVSGGSGEGVKRRAGRRNALVERKDIVVVRKRTKARRRRKGNPQRVEGDDLALTVSKEICNSME
jgi:hypothetical protein